MDPTQPYRRLVSSLGGVLKEPGASDEALSDGAAALLDGAAGAVDLCLSLMARDLVGLESFERAAFGAMVTGALVEMGADPAPATLALTTVLGRALPPMARYHSSKQGAALPDEEAIRAWESMATLYRPAVAILSPSAQGRNLARAHLGDGAEVLRHHDAGGWFVWRLLRILDDEPVRVTHPDQGADVRVRISGVADNLQLQVLLMEALSREGILECPAPDPDWLAVARGDAPQQISGTVTGAWDLSSPVGPIPLDGDPADIPLTGGERTLILHDADPPPTWHNSRMFATLPAAIT